MHTSLFNSFRTLLREETLDDVIPLGEQTPVPTSALAEPPAPATGNENPVPGEGEDISFNLDAYLEPDSQPGEGKP